MGTLSYIHTPSTQTKANKCTGARNVHTYMQAIIRHLFLGSFGKVFKTIWLADLLHVHVQVFDLFVPYARAESLIAQNKKNVSENLIKFINMALPMQLSALQVNLCYCFLLIKKNQNSSRERSSSQCCSHVYVSTNRATLDTSSMHVDTKQTERSATEASMRHTWENFDWFFEFPFWINSFCRTWWLVLCHS